MTVTIFRDENPDNPLSYEDAVYEDGKYSSMFECDVTRMGLSHKVVCFNSKGADETYEWPEYEEGAQMLANRQRRHHEMEARRLSYAKAWCAWEDQDPGAEKPCRL